MKDYYKHINETDEGKLTLQVSIPEVAEMVCSQNYGAHRLLSALVDELRKRNEKYKKESESKGFKVESDSPLAQGIEALLNKQMFY
jgi:hypothetical protein